MKKLIVFIATALAMCSALSASAAPDEKANHLNAGYNLTTFAPNKHFGGDSDNLHGFYIEYTRSFFFSKATRFYGEAGLNLQCGFYDKKESETYRDEAGKKDKWTIRTQVQNITAAIPLNVGYSIRCSEQFSIAPYLGLNLKLNVMLRDRISDNKDYLINSGILGFRGDQWHDLFSDNKYTGAAGQRFNRLEGFEISTYENTWERFQLGWHVGVVLDWKNARIGVRYGTDFLPAYHHGKNRVNTSNLTVGLGWNF